MKHYNILPIVVGLLTIFVLSLTPTSVYATGQTSEVIYWKGQKYQLLGLPLASNHALDSLVSTQYNFKMTNTALWRGYIGHWSIDNDLLVLDSICVETDNTPKMIAINLNDCKAFDPYRKNGKIYASWVNKELRIASGKTLKYEHMGFNRNYEQESIIQIKDGRIVQVKSYDNKVIVDGIWKRNGRKDDALLLKKRVILDKKFNELFPEFKKSFDVQISADTINIGKIKCKILKADKISDLSETQKAQISSMIAHYCMENKMLSIYQINGECVSDKVTFSINKGMPNAYHKTADKNDK